MRQQEIKEIKEKAGCLGEISEEIMGDIGSLLDEEKIYVDTDLSE